MPNPSRADHATAEQDARRALFPRGLAQPAHGFRFAADTLLLAAFAARGLKPGRPGRALRGLDIGTGCGAAAFGLLLLRPEPDLGLSGIDTSPEMLACAAENAEALGLAGRFAPFFADAADYSGPACDFALCNPPFRAPGTGRACPDPGRGSARFEGPAGFALFAACAARSLRTRGTLFLVHLAERLPELLAALTAHGLAAKRLLPVQGRAGQNPRLVLLSALRGGGPGLELLPPLTLYDADGKLTPGAAAFCPLLAVNASRAAAMNRARAPLANTFEEG